MPPFDATNEHPPSSSGRRGELKIATAGIIESLLPLRQFIGIGLFRGGHDLRLVDFARVAKGLAVPFGAKVYEIAIVEPEQTLASVCSGRQGFENAVGLGAKVLGEIFRYLPRMNQQLAFQ